MRGSSGRTDTNFIHADLCVAAQVEAGNGRCTRKNTNQRRCHARWQRCDKNRDSQHGGSGKLRCGLMAWLCGRWQLNAKRNGQSICIQAALACRQHLHPGSICIQAAHAESSGNIRGQLLPQLAHAGLPAPLITSCQPLSHGAPTAHSERALWKLEELGVVQRIISAS